MANRRLRLKPKGEQTHRRGQSLVEFALSMTLMLILLGAIFDAGRAYVTYLAMHEAAQEGASYGTVARSSGESVETVKGKIKARVRESANGPIAFSDPSQVAVSVELEDLRGASGSWCAENLVKVTTAYTFTVSAPFIGMFIGSQTIPLIATEQDVLLLPACPE